MPLSPNLDRLGGPSSAFVDLNALLRRTNEACDDACAALGLTKRDVLVLAEIGRGSPRLQREIASTCGIHPSSLPAIIAKLTRVGFIRGQEVRAWRGRGRFHRLTSKGRSALEQIEVRLTTLRTACMASARMLLVAEGPAPDASAARG